VEKHIFIANTFYKHKFAKNFV